MEYPEGLDWEWFACDRDGEIACFVTFGQAPIPKAVLDYTSFPIEDAPDGFYKLTSNPAASWELEIPGLDSFTERCIAGLAANRQRIGELVDRSLMLVTALAPQVGYDAAARIAKQAHAEGLTLREAALASGLVDAATFDALVRPENMV